MHAAEGEFVVTAFGVDGTRRQGFACRLVDPSTQAIVCVSQEVAGGLSVVGQQGGIGSGITGSGALKVANWHRANLDATLADLKALPGKREEIA